MHRNSPPRLQLGFHNLTEKEKKKTSKMKKLKNHSQLKEQPNSPEAVNNETHPCSLIDSEFKGERVKILKELKVNMKELRTDIGSDADYFRKGLENIRRSQDKLENSLAETQTES